MRVKDMLSGGLDSVKYAMSTMAFAVETVGDWAHEHLY
jgi:hypothetical protein